MSDEVFKLMNLLTDAYAIKILAASYNREKSAIELSQELNVPIAACYRRLKWLETMNLVRSYVKKSDKGKKIRYYLSRIRLASIRIEGNSVLVELTDRDGKVMRFSGIVGTGYGQ